MIVKNIPLLLTLLALQIVGLPALAQQQSFRVVTSSFPPLVDSTLEDKGQLWQMIKGALEKQGYQPILDFLPWHHAISEAEKGRYDALFLTYETPERTRNFRFDAPLLDMRSGLFRRKERDDIRFSGDLKALAGYRIGVGKGYSVSLEFDRADYLDKVECVSYTTCLIKLYDGELDLVAGDELMELHLLEVISRKPGYADIEDRILFMQPNFEEEPLYMAISRNIADSQEKSSRFAAAIKDLLESEEYQEMLRRHGVEP